METPNNPRLSGMCQRRVEVIGVTCVVMDSMFTFSLDQAVFYLDAYCRPRQQHLQRFKKVALQLAQSRYGIAQDEHAFGLGALVEFERIISKRKDIPENVDKSIAWLQAQPDFSANCTLYSNQYIAYDPKSYPFQKATQFLWNHYSLEQDSWRDQPLWCYVLNRFNITPASSFNNPLKAMFKEYKHRMGHGGHQYNETNENAN